MKNMKPMNAKNTAIIPIPNLSYGLSGYSSYRLINSSIVF